MRSVRYTFDPLGLVTLFAILCGTLAVWGFSGSANASWFFVGALVGGFRLERS